MKAAVLNAFGQPLSLEQVQIEPPRAGEVMVRIGATGVCHSDYHVIRGEWKYGLPMILGHEAAGVVEALGEGVTGVQPGDHVVLSFRPACGMCRLCAQGRGVLCEGRTGDRFRMFDGTSRVHRNGEDILVLARVGSFASTMFSATVITGISMKCWCTIPIPRSIASWGDVSATGWPLIRISPSSGA